MRAQLANGQLGGLTVAAQRVCVCACVACLSMEPMCVRCAASACGILDCVALCVLCARSADAVG